MCVKECVWWVYCVLFFCRLRGFGFVTYAKAFMADKALEARHHIVDGTEVDLKRALTKIAISKAEMGIPSRGSSSPSNRADYRGYRDSGSGGHGQWGGSNWVGNCKRSGDGWNSGSVQVHGFCPEGT